MDLPPDAPSGPAETPPPLPATPPPPPALPRRIRRRSPWAAAILGWAVPGLGQVYAGRPGKALVLAATIVGLFYAGWAMTGFTGVDPYTYGLEFVAHAWIGGPTAYAYWTSRDIVLTDPLPWLEVGRLYAAVAGLLNIVAICDALGGVLEHNVRAAERAAERKHLETQYEEQLARFEAARAPAAADVALGVDLDTTS